MGVGAGLYMYHVVVKCSRSVSHLLMSSCKLNVIDIEKEIKAITNEFFSLKFFKRL